MISDQRLTALTKSKEEGKARLRAAVPSDAHSLQRNVYAASGPQDVVSVVEYWT